MLWLPVDVAHMQADTGYMLSESLQVLDVRQPVSAV